MSVALPFHEPAKVEEQELRQEAEVLPTGLRFAARGIEATIAHPMAFIEVSR